jgi:hypothetical protein
VLSVDGATGEGKENGVIDLVYGMHKADTRCVKKAVDKVINPPEDSTEKKDTGAKSTRKP